MRLGENLGRLFLMGRDPKAPDGVMILTSPPRERDAANSITQPNNPKYDRLRISSMLASGWLASAAAAYRDGCSNFETGIFGRHSRARSFSCAVK